MITRKFFINLILLAVFAGLAIFALGKTQLKDKTKWIFILVIVGIFFIVSRKADWAGKIDQALFSPTDIDHSCGDAKVSEDRKTFLKDMAGRIYTDIYNTPLFGHDCSVYTEANALCDEELIYVADYYKKYLTSGVSIYSNLSGWNGEYTLFCDFDTLKAHLSRIGQRS